MPFARSRRADSNGCGITSGDGLEPQLQAFQVEESRPAGPVLVFDFFPGRASPVHPCLLEAVFFYVC